MKKTTKNRFLVGPYLFTMSNLLLILLIGSNIHMYNILDVNMRVFTIDTFAFVYLLGLSLIVLGTFIACGHQFYGVMEIGEDSLVFRAPLRRKIEIFYSEMTTMGIDYVVVNASKQYWIYFSKDPLPPKCVHRINQLRFKKGSGRIQYRKKVYDALIENVPYNPIGKTLIRLAPVIRQSKLDGDSKN